MSKVEEAHQRMRKCYLEWQAAKQRREAIQRDRDLEQTSDRVYQHQQALRIEVDALKRYSSSLTEYAKTMGCGAA